MHLNVGLSPEVSTIGILVNRILLMLYVMEHPTGDCNLGTCQRPQLQIRHWPYEPVYFTYYRLMVSNKGIYQLDMVVMIFTVYGMAVTSLRASVLDQFYISSDADVLTVRQVRRLLIERMYIYGQWITTAIAPVLQTVKVLQSLLGAVTSYRALCKTYC